MVAGNKGHVMTFAQLSHHFDRIQALSGRIAITQELAAIFARCTPEEAHIVSYLVLGQLRPAYYGTYFYIAHKGMCGIVARVLEISSDELQYRLQQYGDLGTIISHGSWHIQEYLDITTVYDQLERFENISGAGSQEEKADYLVQIIQSVTPQSARYIVRIMLGKLRLGFSEMTIVDALSWYVAGTKKHKEAIEYAFHRCADIGRIARAIVQYGIEGVAHIDVELGIPVRMAAAERLSSFQAVINRLGVCAVQPKLDGFRLQVHIWRENAEPTMRFFSRNLADMSHMFPDIRQALEQLDVQSVIIEGEAVAYDVSTGYYLPFQETMKRRRKYDVQQAINQYPLSFMVFDILYHNGASILHWSHTQRRALLKQLLDSQADQRVRLVEEERVHNEQELSTYFHHMITAGLEGVVVRSLDAPYQPGKRSYNWIKLKRKQANQLEDTLDCVVLGYYYGHGRRAAFGIGAFLVGVYNADTNTFETIAKVGTGLHDTGWQELKRTCDRYRVDHMPSYVHCHRDLMPDVIIEPHVVVVIGADEITQSPLHTAGRGDTDTGLALRFPRFIEYRIDKSAQEATTVAEVRYLYKQQ